MLIRWLRFHLAWRRWFFSGPGFRFGDPTLGRSREQRDRNIDLMMDRWAAKEPKRGK